jgi:hypothetical protein
MAAVPTTVPINHNGIRPVVPVLDIIVKRNFHVSEKSRIDKEQHFKYVRGLLQPQVTDTTKSIVSFFLQ